MKKAILILTYTLLFLYTNTSAQSKPELTLETGMHISAIRKIASDAEGKYLLSCSEDKTARLWDAANGTLLKVYRVPSDNRTGKLFASSISPDAKLVAVGGETDFEEKGSYTVYIFNTQTATITHSIKDLSETINDLAFSPNGKWLAISLWGNKGIEIYDTQTWELTKRLSGYEGTVYSMCFNAARNEFATVSFDGMLRLYDNAFTLITQADCDADKEPISIACNRTGNLFAIGYNQSPYVEVRDAKTLAVSYYPSVKGAEGMYGKMQRLCFSTTGNSIYGCGDYYARNEIGNWMNMVRIWKKDEKENFSDTPVSCSKIFDMKPIGRNRIAFAADYPEIGVMNDSGIIVWHKRSEKIDYDIVDSHFGINKTGNEIAIDTYSETLFSFNVSKRSISTKTTDRLSYEFPVSNNWGTSISNYYQASMPIVNGKPLSYIIGRYERCVCADVSNDGKWVCIATNSALHLVSDSVEQVWKIPLLQTIKAVNISGNGKLVAAIFLDGMVRWYNMKNGKPVLSLFIHADKKQWILFTPEGYYDASPGAEDLLSFIVDNGPDKEPASYPASKFKKEYYRPDIIDKVLVNVQ